MLDAAVLSACLASRKAFDKVAPYVEIKELSPQAGFWWPFIEEWYAADSHAIAIDVALLRDRGKRNMDAKHESTLLGWYDELPEPVSPENAAIELLSLKQQQLALEVAHAVQTDPEGSTELMLRLIELNNASSLETVEFEEATLAETFLVMDRANMINLYPSVLNERLNGGAVRGDFILIFGRPNAGKTLFALNMACGMAKDGREVVYILNEEKKEKIHMRMVCNLVNGTETAIRRTADTEIRAQSLARQRGIDNIKLYSAFGASPRDIERHLDKHPNADVLIVDQLRHLESAKSKSMTQKLEDNAVALRNIIGRHDVVGVFVTQAGHHDVHGDAPIWLRMSDIDNSRTGLPGAADVIIGIGVNDDMDTHGTRAISLPKIKGGDDRGFTVQCFTEKSRIV